ncbi:MAG: NTP transferase domain-containing protein [Methanobrevibacter sp.]|uniref:nucleotidyltransferase family protein n=1 Tax=Methanobrevibacter sp. TaxID=66852 RepID=UPI0026E06EB6|nr:NTP transferase domain-containing protein [Methanobrevibacter sp.]MDO5849225.1 NTP transferase domain-containing protein [Methanobrevibacter sp.]
MSISTIITAAGKNSRMRKDQLENNLEVKNKLVLPLNNSTVIENTIDNVLSLDIGECIVVLGHYKDEIIEAISKNYDDNVKFVVNDPVDVGLSVSLLNGLQNTNSKYALCVTGDQPTVSTETLNNIIDTLLNADNPDNTVSVLRRRKTGLLDTAEGLGMPFAMNRNNLIEYIKNENDNLNPILRRIFKDGYEFWGIKEKNELELLNINHYKDYKHLLDIH